MPKKKKSAHDEALLHLRAVGLAYPGAHKKAPWPDHWDLAVNDKTFAYLSFRRGHAPPPARPAKPARAPTPSHALARVEAAAMLAAPSAKKASR